MTLLSSRAESVAPLIRVLGRANSGRTRAALGIAAQANGTDSRGILVVDTLGHGPASLMLLLPDGLQDRIVHQSGSRLAEVFPIVRRMVASGSISCVIIDDVSGFEDESAPDLSRRQGAIRQCINSLTSLCLAQKVRCILVDRISPMGVTSTPLGFVDRIVESDGGNKIAA